MSVEGGGAWVVGAMGAAHFLFQDGDAARRALEQAGIRVVEDREVVTARLRQDIPGQLGEITRRMAQAGVNIEVMYSDHDNQLILVVDDISRAREAARRFAEED
ncbi:MAG: amino acid-binding ACT domain-containing protein [Actinomycetota bacterium]|nr:amino acid-binding ACT domain-containing protein [Actinomycetota bacterium]